MMCDLEINQPRFSDSNMAPPAIWLDHIAFCRRHGFDHKMDLEPQFKAAFEAFGRDFEQIRGSVSILTLWDLF